MGACLTVDKRRLLNEVEPGIEAAPAAALVKNPSLATADAMLWTPAAWLKSLDFTAPVAMALAPLVTAGVPHISALRDPKITRDKVKHALRAASLGGMIDIVWPAIQQLRTHRTAAELHAKVGSFDQNWFCYL